MKLYPEMNKKIVELLRLSGDPHQLYAAARIEELEQLVEQQKKEIHDLTTTTKKQKSIMDYLWERRK